MFDKIRRLGSDTAVYGVSTIIGRLLTFFLTPIYANVLPPSDLGIVATVYACIAFLNVVYGFGMESAFFKFASTNEHGGERENFSVPLVAVAISSVVLSLIIVLFAPSFSALLGVGEYRSAIVWYAAIILLLDALAVIPFAALRLERKAKQFAAIRLTGIVVHVVATLIMIIPLRMGIEGIFLSNILASTVVLVLLLPILISRLSWRWNGVLFSKLLDFGLPTVPAGLAAMVVQVIDRPILLSLTDSATVGVYQANYRLGIFMMLVVSTFDFAWRPFFLSHAKEDDAKPLFARVFTYLVLFMSFIFLVVSFFISDSVQWPVFFGRSLLPQPYWIGLHIVPIILLGYLFLGMCHALVAGIYIEKRTRFLPWIAAAGAIINIVANYVLIPLSSLTGAAFATLLSYLGMAIIMYAVVQRFYRIEYEFDRLLKIAIAALAVFLLFVFVKVGAFAWLWKTGLLILFCGTMYAMKFFNPSELARIASMFKRKTPSSVTDAPINQM